MNQPIVPEHEIVNNVFFSHMFVGVGFGNK